MRYIHAELLVREIMTLGHLILQKQAFGCLNLFDIAYWTNCFLLSAVEVHTTTHCRLYREQQLGPALHKAGHAYKTKYLSA
jgi:hypothetical protein